MNKKHAQRINGLHWKKHHKKRGNDKVATWKNKMSMFTLNSLQHVKKMVTLILAHTLMAIYIGQ
jgi:hypothetical protein